MTKAFFFTLCGMGVLSAQQAMAGISLSYTGTHGSQGYTGTNLGFSLDSTIGPYMEGGFNQSQSNTSPGTFKTYSGGLGIYRPGGSFGLSSSFTPKVEGYQALSIGLDARGRVLNWEDLGGFQASLGFRINRTTHQDDVQLVEEKKEGETRIRGETLSIHQNDITGNLRLQWRKVGSSLSLGLTQSLYDEDLAGNFLRECKVVKFEGILGALQGYSDRMVFAKISQDILPWLWTSASYNRVQYNLATASANSFNLEAGINWQSLEATLGYNTYVPSSGPSRKFIAIGAGLRF
ncbi:MAG: hypothetical protein HY399_02510 [Elusimicrobia bacterium]|nr:hypothetical protein [Elusimicrobiota bacterium]